MEVIQRKSRSGFDKVHAEIRGLFRHKSTSDAPPPLYPRPKVKHRNISEGSPPDNDGENKNAKATDKNKPKSKSNLQKNVSSYSSSKQPETKGVTRSKSNASGAAKVPENPDFYLTPTEDNGEEIDVYYTGQDLRNKKFKMQGRLSPRALSLRDPNYHHSPHHRLRMRHKVVLERQTLTRKFTTMITRMNWR